MEGKEKGKTWKDSLARRLLEEDLTTGTIPLSSEQMGPREVYIQRHEFSEFPYENFQANLRSLRKSVQEKKNSSSFDSAALLHDRQIYPKKQERWEGSLAEMLLKQDINDNKHLLMKPMQLYNSRPEYHSKLQLTVFRKHIEQEVRRRKFIAYLQKKESDTKAKKFGEKSKK